MKNVPTQKGVRPHLFGEETGDVGNYRNRRGNFPWSSTNPNTNYTTESNMDNSKAWRTDSGSS